MADNSGVTGPSAMPAKRKINSLLTAVQQKNKNKGRGPEWEAQAISDNFDFCQVKGYGHLSPEATQWRKESSRLLLENLTTPLKNSSLSPRVWLPFPLYLVSS